MIIGIRFSSFAPVAKPQGPIGVPTGYQPASTNPVIPVHNQQVKIDG
jgi:hypothetical protein